MQFQLILCSAKAELVALCACEDFDSKYLDIAAEEAWAVRESSFKQFLVCHHDLW
jgi:hypothetical protein